MKTAATNLGSDAAAKCRAGWLRRPVQLQGEHDHELPKEVFGSLVARRQSHDFQTSPIIGDAQMALVLESAQQSLVGSPGNPIEPKTLRP